MPLYEYVCNKCDLKHSAHMTIDQYEQAPTPNCPVCDQYMRRDWHLQIAPVMQEQWAPPVGKMVSDNKQFEDALKEKSDEASARLGYDVNYVSGSKEDTKRKDFDG
jgi:transcription elongation factor Elf1